MSRTHAQSSRIRELVTASLLAALMAATAWITIRIGPVPFTLQTTFVLLAGLLLSPGWAAASMGIYLLLGGVGLPVFSGGTGGFQALVGPTGGFLIAFPFAAALLSAVRRSVAGPAPSQQRALVADVGGVIAAEAAIYAIGLPWLMFSTGLDLTKALAVAVVPFIVPDVVKAAIAILGARAVRKVR